MLSLTNEENTDWSALLGRPRAVRIAYVLPSRRGLLLPEQERAKVNVAANYHLLHWRPPHIQGLEFAELDSYDIRGLSAMIYRCVRHHRIRYIICATGEGRRRLRRHPNKPLTFIEYIFIESDEDVRTWLLSNSGLDDPLDLLLYCYRDRSDERQDTAELRSLPYLDQDAIRLGARDPAARIGQPHFRALEPDARPAGGQANEGEEAPGDDTSNISSSESAHEWEDDGDEAPGDDTSNILSSASAHESEDISGILPSPVGERAESPANRIPLATKSSSMLNRQLPLDSLHRPAQVDKERKRGAHFDTENCDGGTPKKLRLSSIKEFLKAKEVRKRGAQFDDDNSEEPRRKRLREDSVGGKI